MFKNNLKIIWRNLVKDRQFTILNLLGLSTGLACMLLIYLWVSDELSVDKYNENDKQLYQVMQNLKTAGGIKTMTYTAGLLGKSLAKEMPEVEYGVSILPASWFPFKGVISSGDTHIKAGGQYVSKDYFNAFTMHFTAGDKNRLFADKSTVAISEELARKFFNTTQDVIGKTLKWDQSEFGGSFIISGVFKKTPTSATDQFDLMFNYDLVLERRPNLLNWGNSDPSTFIIVKKGTDIARLNGKLKNFVDKKDKNSGKTLFLTRFSDNYLYGEYENGVLAGGRIAYVKLFSIIAVFILIIACINFMNLSTARASRRLKEVGIKKVVGATRSALIFQYLGESLLMAFLSLILSVIFMSLLLGVFNEITGKQLDLHFNANLILSILGITLLTGLISGSYPAFYLSSFNPVTVLKGKLSTSFGELWVRKGLVIFQFTLSVVFIAAVLIVYRQLNYIQSRNLGYNRDNIIHFEIPLENDSLKLKAAATFINELQNIPGVVNASSYYHNLTGEHGAISGFEWPGKPPNMDIEFSNLEVGYNFLETAGIKIKEGRNFSQTVHARDEIIFNETAIKEMGLKNPVGKMIKFWGMQRQIIGIAADFNFESLYQTVKPCFFQVYPAMPNVMVKIKAGTEKQTIDKIQQAFLAFTPGMAFDYRFLDQDYQALYNAEKKVGILSRYFAGLAIIISCLGLFGLAAFTAQRRQKEIGIRKVVGASVSNVAFLLSGEFLKLVLIAVVIAFPLVWWAMNNWLNDFAYRIHITADIFLITGFLAIVITVVTISFQAIKAAVANPMKSLRTE
ncbi:MAG TPA: FtsX-like permease family protein [Puia sp.]|jgi:putative ABC transport system permease protein|nr:FtsX-like permease family protein [Puia sp.]